MNRTLLIIGIIITSLSLLAITVFSLSNFILKQINKAEEKSKSKEDKQKEKRFKRALNLAKKIIKNINKQLIKYYLAMYGIAAASLTTGVALVTVATTNIIQENNSSSEDPSSEDSSEPQSEDSSINYFTITWKNYDGTVLDTQTNVAEGTTPSYTGATTPSKAPTTTINYVFDGWEPAIATVTGDATYTAKFKEETRLYSVKWINEDNSLIQEDMLEYQDIPSFEGVPSYGPTAQYTYEFNDWDKEIVPVTEDTTYKATYLTTTNKYTIYWVDDDLSELITEYEMDYGIMPSYPGNTPEKEQTDHSTFEFIGWDPEPSMLVCDVTYKATYKETINVYTVTWLDDDGVTELGKTYVEHGHPAIFDTIPYKPPYPIPMVFDGWSGDTTSVTGDTAFTATYRQAKAYYLMTIHNPYDPAAYPVYELEGTRLIDDIVAIKGSFADPNDAHHRADQLYKDAGLTELYDLEEPILGDLDIYASYYEEFKVSYVVDNIEVGSEYIRDGYTATGSVSGYESYTWFYEDDPSSTQFNFLTPIVDDIVLYGYII